jgi:hypothetical protein
MWLLIVSSAGDEAGSDLLTPAIKITNAAIRLMEATDGDLAGWLGDLAPRGDLDSAQILYRMCWADVATLQYSTLSSDQRKQTLAVAVTRLTRHAVPLLSLAYRMLRPHKSDGNGNGANGSSSGGPSSGAGAGSSISSSEQGKSKGGSAGPPSGCQSNPFVSMCLASPHTMKAFVCGSNYYDGTYKAMGKVRERVSRVR